MPGKFFRLDYEDAQDAIHILYRFFSCPALTRPECTAWRGVAIGRTLDRDTGPQSERAFAREISAKPYTAITCVAATDRADTRRVVLRYHPELPCLILSFPMAEKGLSTAEKALLRYLQAQ